MESKTLTYEEKTVKFTRQPSPYKTVTTAVTVRELDEDYIVTIEEHKEDRQLDVEDKTKDVFVLSEYSAIQLKKVLASFGL